ncbi:hypothetical protein BDK51DRAFT_32856 [Blyttiomyces helicus]|uniref:Major facilitator superfamily domain-containing protein n=1 Tax=Blyttiomyces helicus TaxID=388810 RepID=A0A4P9WLR8_9FUNG|nr:hypothetical protein BDK51DRAFT_32856 [Blyttiomyces helicus]|eukprot:RKO93135.1 hypothetical protein BDK51DRAFT_32856 [Blyttiomyces helicus]
MVAHFFPRHHLGISMGLILGWNHAATAIGNAMMGVVFDRADHWSLAFWVTATVAIGSVSINLVYNVVSARAQLEKTARRGGGRARELRVREGGVRGVGLRVGLGDGAAGDAFAKISPPLPPPPQKSDLIQKRFAGSTAQAAYKTTISLVIPAFLYLGAAVIDRHGQRLTLLLLSTIALTSVFVLLGLTNVNPIVSMVLFAGALAGKGLAQITAIPAGPDRTYWHRFRNLPLHRLNLLLNPRHRRRRTPRRNPRRYDRVMTLLAGRAAAASVIVVGWMWCDPRACALQSPRKRLEGEEVEEAELRGSMSWLRRCTLRLLSALGSCLRHMRFGAWGREVGFWVRH